MGGKKGLGVISPTNLVGLIHGHRKGELSRAEKEVKLEIHTGTRGRWKSLVV